MRARTIQTKQLYPSAPTPCQPSQKLVGPKKSPVNTGDFVDMGTKLYQLELQLSQRDYNIQDSMKKLKMCQNLLWPNGDTNKPSSLDIMRTKFDAVNQQLLQKEREIKKEKRKSAKLLRELKATKKSFYETKKENISFKDKAKRNTRNSESESDSDNSEVSTPRHNERSRAKPTPKVITSNAAIQCSLLISRKDSKQSVLKVTTAPLVTQEQRQTAIQWDRITKTNNNSHFQNANIQSHDVMNAKPQTLTQTELEQLVQKNEDLQNSVLKSHSSLRVENARNSYTSINVTDGEHVTNIDTMDLEHADVHNFNTAHNVSQNIITPHSSGQIDVSNIQTLTPHGGSNETNGRLITNQIKVSITPTTRSPVESVHNMSALQSPRHSTVLVPTLPQPKMDFSNSQTSVLFARSMDSGDFRHVQHKEQQMAQQKPVTVTITQNMATGKVETSVQGTQNFRVLQQTAPSSGVKSSSVTFFPKEKDRSTSPQILNVTRSQNSLSLEMLHNGVTITQHERGGSSLVDFASPALQFKNGGQSRSPVSTPVHSHRVYGKQYYEMTKPVASYRLSPPSRFCGYNQEDVTVPYRVLHSSESPQRPMETKNIKPVFVHLSELKTFKNRN